jgi:hypothetical protein
MNLLFCTKSILFNSLFAPLRVLTAKYDGNMELHEMRLRIPHIDGQKTQNAIDSIANASQRSSVQPAKKTLAVAKPEIMGRRFDAD